MHKCSVSFPSTGNRLAHQSVFIDEAVLDISYVPRAILHRENELRMLESLFDNMVTAPYEMSQKAIILGGVGSGKTLLAQYYGRALRGKAQKRRIPIEYIHVNCRELRGSLFMILSRVVKRLKPEFPERGYSANELLDILKEVLKEEELQILLCLDEVDVLIENEGGEALYYLSRFHETDPDAPRLLNLLCISKDPEVFRKLDRSTLSSLQQNVIRMLEYDQGQLSDILLQRIEQAFRKDAVPLEIVDFISDVAAREHGDARYAIDILRRAGKYADTENSYQIKPDHVRNAAMGLFPVLNKQTIRQLSLHEQLTLLSVARFFISHEATEAMTGEIEDLYHLICEEYKETPRGHTQFWKYLKTLKGLDFVNMKLQTSGEGRTQLISLEKVPAGDLEREVKLAVEQG
ncbi:AAA family ATPase [Candidatus Bathyarchaeota archaeon]|nr:AAA family ATPase [Candidatus Bathyarchaeota archaeon]